LPIKTDYFTGYAEKLQALAQILPGRQFMAHQNLFVIGIDVSRVSDKLVLVQSGT